MSQAVPFEVVVVIVSFVADLEVTEKPINLNDFDEVIDPKTGAKVLKLKADVARRAGMTGLLDAQFETYVDAKTGKQSVRVKQGTDAGGTGICQRMVDIFLSELFRCEI